MSFQGLTNGSTLMKIQSGQTVPSQLIFTMYKKIGVSPRSRTFCPSRPKYLDKNRKIHQFIYLRW